MQTMQFLDVVHRWRVQAVPAPLLFPCYVFHARRLHMCCWILQ